MHPLSSQCTAKSKRSGNRCQHMVVGGGVCWLHGGRAPRSQAAREARILAWQAAAAGGDVEPRDPGEALLAATHDADAVLQRLKVSLSTGDTVPSALLSTVGDWVDRVARLAKIVIDARIGERRVQLEVEQAKFAAVTLGRMFEFLGLPLEQRASGLEFFRSEVRAELDVGQRAQDVRLLESPRE